MKNQWFSDVCMQWDSLVKMRASALRPYLATQRIQAATGHKIGHTRIEEVSAPHRCLQHRHGANHSRLTRSQQWLDSAGNAFPAFSILCGPSSAKPKSWRCPTLFGDRSMNPQKIDSRQAPIPFEAWKLKLQEDCEHQGRLLVFNAVVIQYRSVWAAFFRCIAHMVEQFLNSRIPLLAERFTRNEVTQRPIAFEL
jgi:hypothetical protein